MKVSAKNTKITKKKKIKAEQHVLARVKIPNVASPS